MRTVPLPSGISMEQGSMLLVNPMTAMAFIEMARAGRHRALVNNAAASSLGKMLIRLTQRYSIQLISIVRREEQVRELRDLGAAHVLNSTGESFEEDLKKLAHQLNASLFLDAVNGRRKYPKTFEQDQKIIDTLFQLEADHGEAFFVNEKR